MDSAPKRKGRLPEAFWSRTLLGLAVTYLAASICVGISGIGGFGNEHSIVLGSLGCTGALFVISLLYTGGLALLIWIPLWYGIGTLASALVRGRLGYPTRNPRLTALRKFISAARENGMSDELIRLELVNNRWNEDEIIIGFENEP